MAWPIKRRRGRKRPPASEVLDQVRDKARAADGERVSIGYLIEGAGPRIYGLAIMLLALPEAIPIPAAGVTTVVAIPLFALSAWMILYGSAGRLPGWVRRRTVKRSWVDWAVAKANPWIRRIERVVRPRLPKVTEAGRLVGVAVLGLTFLMALPMPLTNALPGSCAVVLGLGVFQRDGLVVLAAMLVGAGMFTATAYALLRAGEAVL